MPRSKKKKDLVDRDFVMARLGAALAELDQSRNAVSDALSFFVSPDEDKSGAKRSDMIDTALEHASCAVRALELADDNADEYDPKEAEPWDDEDEDEDEEDEDEEEDED